MAARRWGQGGDALTTTTRPFRQLRKRQYYYYYYFTIAILDNAFKSKIKTVEEILRTRVKAPRRSLEFDWDPEKMKTPIFRHAEPSVTGIQTSPTKALRYHTYLYYLQRLGLEAGFMQILGAYAIPRGSGEAVDGMWKLLNKCLY